MGGSTGGMPGTGDSQIGNTGGTTGVGTGISIPPPPQPQTMTAQIYNQNLQSGMTDAQMRSMRTGPGEDSPFLYNSTSPNQWNDAVTQAAMQSPTGRPLAGSAQFYQPIQQQQYQNYNMGNPMSISQYGQMNTFNPFMMQGRFNPYTNTMQSPFSFQPQFQPQMGMGGGMGMGMQTPFSSGMSQPAPQRVSSGPAQAIVGRSSGMRGTPNVMMRRAEGGITSLVDAE